jgi:uncharacterized protein (TIGR02145 family)
MKKVIYTILSITMLTACKKETTTPTTINSNTNTTDTTKTSTYPIISELDCNGITMVGKLSSGEQVGKVIVYVKYKGGNGKKYEAQKLYLLNIPGLTAELDSGTLQNGDGEVRYVIYGTPKYAGTANLNIKLGGKECTFNLKVEEAIFNYGPLVTDIENNSYKTVQIGSQLWMAENLKTSKYNDGTSIPNITDNNEWFNNRTGAWAVYNNDIKYGNVYGKLYNWYVTNPSANGNKNVCPTGWHVPQDYEWDILIEFLGGNSAGGKMKETDTLHWLSPNYQADNKSLFTALPAGYRQYSGEYGGIREIGYWWSAKETLGGIKNYWEVNYNNNYITKSQLHSISGLSIRCLKD